MKLVSKVTSAHAASSRLPSIFGAWVTFTACNDFCWEYKETQTSNRGKQIKFFKSVQVFAIRKYKIQIASLEDCRDKYLSLCAAATYTKSVHPLFQRDNLFLQISDNIS